VYINPIVRQRRRQQVLLACLVVLALIVCLLPARDSAADTATASTSTAIIKPDQDIS
jgi:hypothetical protein